MSFLWESLGSLSEVHAGISASLMVCWGPLSSTPDNDGFTLIVQLPQASGGYRGFDLQGLLKTTFGAANLMRLEYLPDDETMERKVYCMLFNNVALKVLGFTLPPQVVTDFILFAGPPSSGSKNLGWNLAATQVSS